jgi:hypothetical protein
MARPLALGFVLLSFVATAMPARAQNFIENSSETINQGNFKLAAFPTGLFGRNGGPDRWGGAVRAGYGFTDNFDVEAKSAFFNGFTLLGADAEVWLLKGDVDLAVSAGGHKALVSGGRDSTAFDLAAQLGRHLTNRLEVYGGTSVSFEHLDGVPNSGFTRAYVIPGVGYKVSDDLDFVSEFGVGLNQNSPHYFGLGFALYIR